MEARLRSPTRTPAKPRPSPPKPRPSPLKPRHARQRTATRSVAAGGWLLLISIAAVASVRRALPPCFPPCGAAPALHARLHALRLDCSPFRPTLLLTLSLALQYSQLRVAGVLPGVGADTGADGRHGLLPGSAASNRHHGQSECVALPTGWGAPELCRLGGARVAHNSSL